MLSEILSHLRLHDLVVLYSKVCLQWRKVIAQFILGSEIRRLAHDNTEFKREITEDYGWKEGSNDNESELTSTWIIFILLLSIICKEWNLQVGKNED